ncbi:hypothetical protein GCM10027082_44490 [Comamonas humi]
MGLWQSLLRWFRPSEPPTLANTAAAAADDRVEPGTTADPLAALDPLPEPAPAQSELPFDSEQPAAEALVAGSGWGSARQRQMLALYGGMAWDRQIDFAALIGEHDWTADAEAGTISFGSELTFPMQVLGSFSAVSGTWRWIWANEQAQVSEDSMVVARQMRVHGEQEAIAFLTEPQYPLAQQDLHQLGLIACGADESAGYYLADYGEGIMLVLIDPGHGLPKAEFNLARVLSVVPQVISQYPMSHRLMLLHYLQAKGMAVQESAHEITATRGSDRLVAQLDAQGRIASLNGQLVPA